MLVEELKSHLLIIDERLGTRIAKSRGILTIGLLGILVKAKVDGHVNEIRPLLDQLQSIGFWIRNELKERILASVRKSTKNLCAFAALRETYQSKRMAFTGLILVMIHEGISIKRVQITMILTLASRNLPQTQAIGTLLMK